MNFENAFRGRWARRREQSPNPAQTSDGSSSTTSYPSSSASSSGPSAPQPKPSQPLSPLPQYSRLPVSSDQHHPLRILHDLFIYSPHSRKGWFNHTAHATFLRQLFFTIWYRPEWLPFFELDKHPEGRKMPTSKDIHDWLPVKDGREKPWSLSGYQKKIKKAPTKKPGAVCGKVLQRFERTYTCKTCALDPLCVLCVECFQASDHEGHEVLFGQSFAFATACDCGDPSAWKAGCSQGCSQHPPLPPDQTRWPPKNSLSTNPAIPQSLIIAMYDTIVICLEFIIGTMEHAPMPSDLDKLPRDLEELLQGFGGTAEAKEKRHQGPWSVAVYTDDKHVLKELVRQFRDALGVSSETAEQLAKEVEEQGRKVILTTPNPSVAFHAANMFQQIDVGMSLRLGSDIFREEIVCVIISWFHDMCKTAIGGDPDLFSRILGYALVGTRITRPIGLGTPLRPELMDLAISPDSRRLDWMFQLDTRLWKKPKWEMRQIYSSISHLEWDLKKQIIIRLSLSFVRISEHYLFHDKEFDSNLLFNVAYGVFGSGQACVYATEKCGLLQVIFDIAQSWYTDQIHEKSLIIPPAPVPSLPIDKHVYRSKKGLTIFGHLRMFLRHEELQRLIVSRPDLFNRCLDFFNMFVGMQPQKREMDQHVEYEIEWPRTFQVLGDLAKSTRELGEAYQHSDANQLLTAMRSAASRIFSDLMLVSTTLDPERFSRPVEVLVSGVLTRDSSFSLIHNYMPHIDAFSFHHYIHLLFAELAKSLTSAVTWKDGKWNGLDLNQVVERYIFGSPNEEDAARMKLMILEWPMQTHVVLSQIRTDMWKKNGVSMRGQSHHYREINVRESTIDQDFHLLQLCLCIMDPLKFMVALIDRWALSNFFTFSILEGTIWVEEDCEPRQMVGLMEDLVALIIYLVTDTAGINNWSREQITRKHLIQHLSLSKLSYAELIKKLPERCIERGSILSVLEQVADFKPPTDTALGSYVLKEEFYDEVDPYWRQFTKNDQRASMDILLERAKKANGNKETFIPPRPLDLPSPDSPFRDLPEFLDSHVVMDVIFWMMAHCMSIADPSSWPGHRAGLKEVPQLENLLDSVLQLCLIAIQVNPRNFAEHSVNIIEHSDAMSIFQNLWLMQTNDAFRSFRPKVDHILEVIVEHLPRGYTKDYRAARDAQKVLDQATPVKSEAKKTAAARQQALLKEFAEKQASFVLAMEEEEDEDDEGDDEVDDEGNEEEESLMEPEEEEEVFGSCIVCQEQVSSKSPGGMLALLQPSRMVREVVHERDWFEESIATPVCLDEATRQVRYGLGTTGEPVNTDAYPNTHLRFGVYISACNHLMHDRCVATYFEATRWRHSQQVQRHHPENAMRMEYLCPLCKSLGNILVPVDRSKTPIRPIPRKDGKLPSLAQRIRSVSEEGLMNVSDSARIWDHHIETGEIVPWFADINLSQSTLDPIYRRQALRPISRMIERMMNLLRPLSEQSMRLRGRKMPIYLPEQVVGYTVAVAEITQRGLGRSKGLTVAEQVPEIQMSLMKRLIGMLQLELDIFFGPKFDRTALRVGLFARFLPDWYRASSLPNPLLMRDPLGIVIEAAALAPDLLHPVIILAYYAELTRVLLGLTIFIRRCIGKDQQPSPRSPPPAEPQMDDALGIFSGFRQTVAAMLRNAGPFSDTDAVLHNIPDQMMSKILYSHTLPFLRRVAIVYYASTGTYVEPDVSLTPTMSEYSKLLKLLAIPHPRETLANPMSTESPIVSRWLTQWTMAGRLVPHLEYPGTYELARLPKLYEVMVLKYVGKRCDKCGTKPSFPAICLHCGKLVCLGGDCCAEGESGECNQHMRECGAGVGMFVDIKRWVLLYLYAGSGSFGHMPYLDSHGEYDISMRRGHRQMLHEGRWEELRRAVWLQHTIPHVTARKLEMTSDGGGWTCL